MSPLSPRVNSSSSSEAWVTRPGQASSCPSPMPQPSSWAKRKPWPFAENSQCRCPPAAHVGDSTKDLTPARHCLDQEDKKFQPYSWGWHPLHLCSFLPLIMMIFWKLNLTSPRPLFFFFDWAEIQVTKLAIWKHVVHLQCLQHHLYLFQNICHPSKRPHLL